MTAPDLAALRDQLKVHEGLRLKPYSDTVGKLTIGYGRNLIDRGITEDEAAILLDNDITDVVRGLSKRFPWFMDLDPIRQRVLVDMGFNLGIEGLSLFKHMLAAIGRRNYKAAAWHGRDSAWYRQVGDMPGQRGYRLMKMLETGEEA